MKKGDHASQALYSKDSRHRNGPTTPSAVPGELLMSRQRGETAREAPVCLSNLYALQRSAGNLAVRELISSRKYASPVVQRASSSYSVRGMGSSDDPSVVNLNFLGSYVIQEPSGIPTPAPGLMLTGEEKRILPEDTSGGRINLYFAWDANIINKVFDDFVSGRWDASIPFTASAEQVITFGSPIVREDNTQGSGAVAVITAGSGPIPGGAYSTVVFKVSASGSSTIGGSAGVSSISASSPFSTTLNFAGGVATSKTLHLITTPPKPIHGPTIQFRVNDSEMNEGQEQYLTDWFARLSKLAQDGVGNGGRILTIAGYASTTGRVKKNRTLSHERANTVERILRGAAGSIASLNIHFFGKDRTATADQVEDPQWRVATIRIDPKGLAQPDVPATPP